ncbi:MAG: hypothetical protein J7605_02680 [Variovorax sp.]|nr:hypothetical protein [Variovorax sp.]
MAPPRELYTGAELLTPPVRPGAQEAYRLPSIVAGKPVTPAQLRAELHAPIVTAAPPPMGRAASRVADPEPAPLPEPPAPPPPAAGPIQARPKVTYTGSARTASDAAQPRPSNQHPATDALALTMADLAHTLEDTAQLLRQAGRALLSNPQTIRGQ